jgi:tRNA (cytidine/uridine-2'-O-)-methyltransferase
MRACGAISKSWLARTCGRRRGPCWDTSRGWGSLPKNGGHAHATSSGRANAAGPSEGFESGHGTGPDLGPELVPDGSRLTWQREDLAVVLVNPQIPQNSGNVSRSCAATKVALHLVSPAFQLDDAKLKRAGLDYWDWVCLKPHPSVEAFLDWFASLEGEKQLFAFSKFGETHYATDGLYKSKTPDGKPVRNFLMFGAETTGLPDSAHDAASHIVRIPMNNHDHVRSINLATSVGVGLWEALRQLDGPVFGDDEI